MNNSHSHICTTHTIYTRIHTLINNALGAVFVILLNDEYNIMIITFQERFLFGGVSVRESARNRIETTSHTCIRSIQRYSMAKAAATYTKQMLQSFSHGVAFILVLIRYSLCYAVLCGCGIKYNLVVSILHIGKSPLLRSIYTTHIQIAFGI